MNDRRVSKYLSLLLRHDPQRAGLTLDRHGWVPVVDVLAALTDNGMAITRADLDRIVSRDEKGRYTIEQDRIRANQGHSVRVDLSLERTAPPAVLYHGTPERNVLSILAAGLRKGQRHHVHLSRDVRDARAVGARRGRATVLRIDAASMARDGYAFYRSANGVWLADSVPARYISVVSDQGE